MGAQPAAPLSVVFVARENVMRAKITLTARGGDANGGDGAGAQEPGDSTAWRAHPAGYAGLTQPPWTG